MNSRLEILVLDDESSVRESLVAILEEAGYSVSGTETVSGAMDILKKKQISIIVSDIFLPEVTGTLFLVKVREAYPGIKFILITGDPDIESASMAVRAGAFDYLTKPVYKAKLLSTVKNASDVILLDIKNNELEKLNSDHRLHLQKLVEERTEELSSISQKIIGIQEEERSRIAKEIHDDLGQSLLVLKLSLQTLCGSITDLHPEQKKEEEILLKELNNIIDRARTISHNLSPSGFSGIGIKAALEELIFTFRKNANLEVILNLEALENFFPENWSIQFYRVVQGILSNIVRHSFATKVSIFADRKSDKLIFSVKDNGIGFNKERVSGADHRPGIGLSIMNERMNSIGGKITIRSEIKQGTEVILEIDG